MIVQTAQFVTLVGAGPVPAAVLRQSLSHAPYAVAADGGAEILLKYGKIPQFLIGDFDSVSTPARAAVPPERQIEVTEQDSTDFDKSLERIRAPLVLGVGFLGRRLDHQLAAMTTLLRPGMPPCILMSATDIVFHIARPLHLSLPAGTRFSLYPMVPVRAKSRGLRWPVDALSLAPDGRISTSNLAEGGAIVITPAGPGLLAILPRRWLGRAIAALVPPDARAG